MKTLKQKIENNILIAEFMEANATIDGEYEMYGIIPTVEDGEWENHFFKPENMPFDTDWNWLMEVCNKIESTKMDNDNYFNVTIGSSNYCVIQDSNGEIYENIEESKENKLLTVYNACVEFVKWYNENKNN